jgi:hypothetical protein
MFGSNALTEWNHAVTAMRRNRYNSVTKLSVCDIPKFSAENPDESVPGTK